MTSKEEFVKLCQELNNISGSPYNEQYDDDAIYMMLSTNNTNEHLYYLGIDLNNIYKDLIKAELFDKLKEVFSKVIYAPFAIDNNGEVECVPKVKLAEDFDKELFRQVLEQCGFEIKEKE